MADVIYLAIIVAFFAVAALFVRACDHIIGADDATQTGTRDPAPPDEAEVRAA